MLCPSKLTVIQLKLLPTLLVITPQTYSVLYLQTNHTPLVTTRCIFPQKINRGATQPVPQTDIYHQHHHRTVTCTLACNAHHTPLHTCQIIDNPYTCALFQGSLLLNHLSLVKGIQECKITPGVGIINVWTKNVKIMASWRHYIIMNGHYSEFSSEAIR